MTEDPQTDYDPQMARRVFIAAGVVLAIAFGVIALSAATLKQDQVNDLPRAPLAPTPDEIREQAKSPDPIARPGEAE